MKKEHIKDCSCEKCLREAINKLPDPSPKISLLTKAYITAFNAGVEASIRVAKAGRWQSSEGFLDALSKLKK